MKTTSPKKTDAKRVDPAASKKGAGYEDRENFARASASPTPEYDTRKVKSARGHDDQGGSRQSESRDYDHVRDKPGSAASDAQQNLGGQDSRDQSTGDRFSLLGRAGGAAGEARDQAIEPAQKRSEQGRRDEERRSAPQGAGYDTNWTREDKGGQPGPAAAGSDKDKERSSGP